VGATVAHGKQLAQERRRYHDGSEGEEIVPIEGDYHSPSYSTIEEAVRICERHGVPRDSWPIFYDGHGRDEIPLDEVSRRCQILRQQLGALDCEVLTSNSFLRDVWVWLSNGEVFCVDE
jgi:hypothetical protein